MVWLDSFTTLGVVILLNVSSVHAGLLAYEQFYYPSTSNGDPLKGLAGGGGWSGPWSGSIAWNGLLITPSPGLETLSNATPLPPGTQPTTTTVNPLGGYAYNPAEILSGGHPYGRVSWRLLANPINLGVDTDYYVSFLFRRITDPNGTYNNLRAVVSFNSGEHPVNDAEILLGVTFNGSNTFVATLNGSSASGIASEDSVINETTYLVVAWIAAASGNGLDRVYFERFKPGSPLQVPDPWDKYSRFNVNNNSIDRIMIWGENALAVDEIRIGTTFASVTTQAVPLPASITTDMDGDGDVDPNDFLTFSNCFNGALKPPRPSCANPAADCDGDGDVDPDDFLTFSNCFNGSLNPPSCP